MVEWRLSVSNGTHPAIPGRISYDLSTDRSFDYVRIAVTGVATLDVPDGMEVAVVDAGEPEDILPAAVIYVAVGLAAGGGIFAAFRHRRNRQEPSRA